MAKTRLRAGQLLSGSAGSADGFPDQTLRTSALSQGQGCGEIVTFGSEDGTESLAAGKLVYLNSSGVWKYTDADAESTTKGLLAIALGTSVSDGLLLRGFYKNGGTFSGATFTVGGPVYVSATAAQGTKTAPGSGDTVRIIGWGVSSYVLYFNPDNNWVVMS